MPDDRAAALAAAFRNGRGALLENRRIVIGLSIFSATVLGGIGLFQTGILKRLPDLPLPRFDSDAINSSSQAYSLLETPDALLGMASYAITACLAGAGGEDRAISAPWIPLAMGAKAAADAAFAGCLAVEQWTSFRKFSFWSLLVAGATFAALPFALAEVNRALRIS
jgi:hypothetical protein